MEAIPIGIFWCLVIWGLCRPQHVLVYLFFATMAFGSFAVIPTAMTGGLTLTPTPVVAMLLIGREFSSASRTRMAVAAALQPSRLLFLFLFWLAAGIATAFMPRFFAGQVQIIPVRSEGLSAAAMLVPTAQNVSQFVYITISVLTVFVFSRMLRSEGMRRHALNALCLGAAMVVLTGVLDLTSQYLPLQSMLEVFRTASYSLMVEDEVLDSKRIVGLMPEASSFGGTALSYLAALYFFKRAMLPSVMLNRVVPVLVGLLALLTWLSTSSSAYLGLALFGATTIFEWVWRFASAGKNPYLRRGLSNEFLFGTVAAILLLLMLIAVPWIFSPIVRMIDVMVLQKSSTSSFEERGMWTQVSWDALLATHGLGVGMGGTRASNFIVALASNAGFLGAALYLIFVVQCLLMKRARRYDWEGETILSACRWAYLPAFCSALTVGTTPDFGLFNAVIYGFALGASYSPFEKAITTPTERRRRQVRKLRPLSSATAARKFHAG